MALDLQRLTEELDPLSVCPRKQTTKLLLLSLLPQPGFSLY